MKNRMLFGQRFITAGQKIYERENSLNVISGTKNYSEKYIVAWDSEKHTLSYYSLLGQPIKEYIIENADDLTFIDDFNFMVKKKSQLWRYSVSNDDQKLISDNCSKLIKSVITPKEE